MTIIPGVTLDLSGNTLLLAGDLQLAGNETQMARLCNSTISADSTQGKITGANAYFSHVVVDDFFSQGSIQLSKSIIEASAISPLMSSKFSSDLFINSTIHASGTKNADISNSTFVNSPITVTAWTGFFGGSLNISSSNFINAGEIIKLDLFFNGPGFSHNIQISNSYIAGITPAQIDSKVFDADDNIRVSTDITPGRSPGKFLREYRKPGTSDRLDSKRH
ncbi:hypothetical protein ACO0LC_10970 [Undibacterium sp. JH2W]|uniref:hypothetical protein n=1 Tax=Undibacterium sp. JH2W TaxID=3413037 RepID=UPI003BF07CC2